MNLNNRIARLERALTSQRCDCDHNADLSWPGHEPNPHCPACGGERLVYPLPHHPRAAEPLIRQALPIIKKAFGNDKSGDLGKLTNQELEQLKTALQAVEQAAKN